jgi:6-hydroxymethylpterin diphosphokinase MptE-like
MSTFRRLVKRVIVATAGEEAAARVADVYENSRSRLEYSLVPNGRRSAAALRAYRDRHRGERCFILGNGPSLGTMDLSPLESEVTFGLNRVYLLFERMGFPTTYLVSVNRHVIEQCADDIDRLPLPTFLSWHSRRFLADPSRAVFVRSIGRPHFAVDPSIALWEGATVTYVALQLAYLMGFRQVILIGVDHSFATKGPAHQLVTSEGDDPNHFDPSYFGKGFRWQLPDLETSEIAYRMARRAFEADDREVLDATVGGKLQVFPKISYDSLFADPDGDDVSGATGAM